MRFAVDELRDEPIQTAEFFCEWGDRRAIEPLRARLAEVERHDTNWPTVTWALTDALLSLGARLTEEEKAARREAFADPELRELRKGVIGSSSWFIHRAPARVARVLADVGGIDAIELLRARLAAFDGRAPPFLERNAMMPSDPGSAAATLALIDALVSMGADLTPNELEMRSLALTLVSTNGPLVALGRRDGWQERTAAALASLAGETEHDVDEIEKPSFTDEFDAALLSLDEQVIRKAVEKWVLPMELPADLIEFWAKVHGVRASLNTYPLEARRLSRE